METFRRFALFFSLIFAVITFLILSFNLEDKCDSTDLGLGLWISACVHLSIFLLLLLHFIKLGGCIHALGRAIGLYYVCIVVAMVFVQQVMF